MTTVSRSSFVSYLALFSIGFAIVSIYSAMTNLMTVNTWAGMAEYKIAEALIPAVTISPTQSYVEIFINAVLIAVSAGLYRRAAWAITAYIFSLSALTIWSITSSVQSYLALSQYLRAFQLGGTLEYLIFSAVLSLAIAVYIIWKLSTKAIRGEFTQNN